jgi:hypothetical protein
MSGWEKVDSITEGPEKPLCSSCGFHHDSHVPCPTVERVYGGPAGNFGVMMLAAAVGSLLLFSVLGIILYVLRLVLRHHVPASWLPAWMAMVKH